MDFWASVEHKLSYKYGQQLPPHLSAGLVDAAQAASDLDQRMARMREEIRPMPRQHRRAAPLIALPARRTEDRPPEQRDQTRMLPTSPHLRWRLPRAARTIEVPKPAGRRALP